MPEAVIVATARSPIGRAFKGTMREIRPGDLTEPSRTGRESDQYLADVIRHGGAPLGRPGMPAFGAALKDEDIRELVTYLRQLARAPGQSP